MSEVGSNYRSSDTSSGEREIWENLAMSIVLGSINMPRQFAPMNLDRDQSQGAGGGPDDPDAENKLPIKPIRI